MDKDEKKIDVVLIACEREKSLHRCAASKMYQNDRFKANLSFALSVRPSKIFILSGKHHLLELDAVIEPYDLNLDKVSESALIAWAEIVLYQLEKLIQPSDHVLIIANHQYRKYLIRSLKNYTIHWED